MATTKKTASATKTKAKTVAAAAARPSELSIPDSYTPISMWGYFGYTFLFAIPLIGWIFCVCFAFFAHNRNLKNYARSQFCWLIIYVIALCFLAGAGVLQSIARSIVGL